MSKFPNAYSLDNFLNILWDDQESLGVRRAAFRALLQSDTPETRAAIAEIWQKIRELEPGGHTR